MVRPQKDRMVAYNPEVSYFKPRGIPMMHLEEVRLTVDEREAIRLSDLLGMSHENAGQRMGVSRATFGRIIQHARQVVADALINGKAINVVLNCNTKDSSDDLDADPDDGSAAFNYADVETWF